MQNFNPMVSRTREKLIEVACQLFAYKGVENTTMSDIANASDKGRRTIYTYFKSKREIYEAALETESERTVRQLRDSIQSMPTPSRKLECFIRYKLEMNETPVLRPHIMGFNSIINLDFRPVRRVRQLTEIKEQEILKQIVDEGIDTGIFNKEQARLLFNIIPLLHPYLETLAVEETSGEEARIQKEDILKFIINSVIQPTR